MSKLTLTIISKKKWYFNIVFLLLLIMVKTRVIGVDKAAGIIAGKCYSYVLE